MLSKILNLISSRQMDFKIIVAILSGFVLLIFVIRKWLRTYHRYDEPVVALKVADNHNWSFANFDLDENVCSFCGEIFSDEDTYYCENCAICCHRECLKYAKMQKCKQITVCSTDSSMNHHWIKGSIPVEMEMTHVCSSCNDESIELLNMICCWCRKWTHKSCIKNITEKCDFGRFHKHIIPPYMVKNVRRRKSVTHFELAISQITLESRKNWNPLIVIVNRKSGESWQGTQVVRYFYQHLNPLQVISLSQELLNVVLIWCKEFDKEGIRSTILVAGGDGSIAWILNTIHDAHLKCVPAIGVIPLGTGNDLSRILGFGGSVDIDLPFSHLIDQLDRFSPTPLDRWHISINSNTRLKLHNKERNLYFYNYFGIGVDAKVAHTFDRFRKLSVDIIRGRLFNKILYAISGTKQAVDPDCDGLPHILEVYMDGVRVELPSVESVVFLNIPSWAGGVDLWALGSMTNQRIDDGQLEVVAINSSFHMATLRADMSQPHVIGQASEVVIKLKDTMAVQADGEPWMQESAILKLSFSNQVTVLKRHTNS